MDLTSIYDVALYADANTGVEFKDAVVAKFAEKGIEVKVLTYFDENQKPEVEKALATWREADKDTPFLWPFLTFKTKLEDGAESTTFYYGEAEINTHIASM